MKKIILTFSNGCQCGLWITNKQCMKGSTHYLSDKIEFDILSKGFSSRLAGQPSNEMSILSLFLFT